MTDQPVSQNPEITIAIADDHIVLRKGICSFIDSIENCKVIAEAENGSELMRILNEKPLPDLCILDISMPEMDGYQTLLEIRKKWPNLKVIIFSVIADQYAMLRMLKLGANGYILKNCIYKEFQKAVLEVCDGGYYFPEIVVSAKSIKTMKSKIPTVSDRQIEFLKLCVSELNYAEIAQKMGSSTRAVESIQQRLSEKLKINSRTGLAIFAIKTGIAQFG